MASTSPLRVYAWAVSLGCVAAAGTFVRFTLPLFAAAPAAALLTDIAVRCLPACAGRRRRLGLAPVLPVDALAIVFLVGLSAAATSAACIVVDSLFFRTLRVEFGPVSTKTDVDHDGGWTSLFGSPLRTSGSLTLTPITSLLYNVDPINLAAHGLHPHWQHALVNAPIMFGPAALLLLVSAGVMGLGRVLTALHRCWGKASPVAREMPATDAAYNNSKPSDAPSSLSGDALSNLLPLATPSGLGALCLGIVACGLGGLSLAAHQEPRFLAPLLLPCVILCVMILLPSSQTPLAATISSTAVPARRPRRSCPAVAAVALWVIFNVGAGTFFGGLHQAGLTSALAALGDTFHASSVAFELARPHVLGAGSRSSLLLPWPQAPLHVPGLRPVRLTSAAANDGVSVVTHGTYMAPKSLLRLPAPWAATAAVKGRGKSSSWQSWRVPRLTAPWCVGPSHLPSSSLSADPALSTRLIDVDVLGAEGAQGAIAAARTAGRHVFVVAPAAFASTAASLVINDTAVAAMGARVAGGGTGASTALPVVTYWPHLSTEHPPPLPAVLTTAASARESGGLLGWLGSAAWAGATAAQSARLTVTVVL